MNHETAAMHTYVHMYVHMSEHLWRIPSSEKNNGENDLGQGCQTFFVT
jgi:hypothetical protein